MLFLPLGLLVFAWFWTRAEWGIKDLVKEVEQNNFREDLFYRLNVVPIHIPPLRERPEDASKLIDLMLNRLADRYQQPRRVLGEAARAKIFRYHWPGNVRELEQCVRRVILKREYSGHQVDAAAESVAVRLREGIANGSIDAHGLMTGYCFHLYGRSSDEPVQ